MQRREESQSEVGMRGGRDQVRPGKSSQVLEGPLVFPLCVGGDSRQFPKNDKGMLQEGWMTMECPGCKHLGYKSNL